MKALAAVALLLLLATGAANGQQISVEAHREGEAVVVEARAHLKADSRLAWEVLTGYDQYARFVPDLKSSEIVARSGNTAIVEQRGVAGFFLFRFPLEVRMAVTEVPYEEVSAQAIAGNFKEMNGLYRLVPEGEIAALDLYRTPGSRVRLAASDRHHGGSHRGGAAVHCLGPRDSPARKGTGAVVTPAAAILSAVELSAGGAQRPSRLAGTWVVEGMAFTGGLASTRSGDRALCGPAVDRACGVGLRCCSPSH